MAVSGQSYGEETGVASKTKKAAGTLHTRRSKSIDLASYDPELERTLQKLQRKIKQKRASVVVAPKQQSRMQKRTRKDTNEQGEIQTKNLEQDEVSTETEKSPKATELNKKDSDKMPKYAKFLKDHFTNKRRFNNQEIVALSEEVAVVLQRKLPPKLKDAGSFTIPCIIGGKEFGFCDLGASIDLVPYSMYESLNLGHLKETKLVIQLANRSNRYPKGFFEDVLVQLNELIFSTNFFVLEMEHDPMPTALPLILGRPFLRTVRAKIDVYDGTLTMEIDGESVKFRIFNAMRYPSDFESCLSIDVFDDFVQDCFNEGVGQDNLKKVLVHRTWNA
ncbi:uncharacterized protein LOC125472153 [Pyrus x bretschneideri]|uniref:uncharacterized protein LOC125472153 n=1 Tax=Pyrus x bretschneideri TaxID=225117 RepID=UPI00202F7273|nr:uncharacterized protein LOC125472153 [Pyrus x bretschneideri]